MHEVCQKNHEKCCETNADGYIMYMINTCQPWVTKLSYTPVNQTSKRHNVKAQETTNIMQ